MRRLRDLSVKTKLTAIILASSYLALLLATSALVFYEAMTFRDRQLEELDTLAKVIASNSTAALAFGDQTAAVEILSALRARSNIVAASIHTRENRQFAYYLSEDACREAPAPGAVTEEGALIEYSETASSAWTPHRPNSSPRTNVQQAPLLRLMAIFAAPEIGICLPAVPGLRRLEPPVDFSVDTSLDQGRYLE